MKPERDRRRRGGRRASRCSRIGVSASRLRKPVWMSRARSVPAFIVANSAPWMNGTAIAKARNESVGKPGSMVDGSQAGGVDRHEQRREEERRDHVRRLAQRAQRRSAGRGCRPGGVTLTRRALSGCSAPGPSSVRPVLARNTSSRLGAWSCRCSTCSSSASSARTTSASPNSSPASRTASDFGETWVELAELRSSTSRDERRRCSRIGGHDLDRRLGRSPPSARPACPRRRSGRGR